MKPSKTRRDWVRHTTESPRFSIKGAHTRMCTPPCRLCQPPKHSDRSGNDTSARVAAHGELWSCCWLQELLASRWKAPLLGMQSYAAQSLCAERFEDRRHARCLVVWYYLLPHEAQCQFRFIFANCLSCKKSNQ